MTDSYDIWPPSNFTFLHKHAIRAAVSSVVRSEWVLQRDQRGHGTVHSYPARTERESADSKRQSCRLRRLSRGVSTQGS